MPGNREMCQASRIYMRAELRMEPHSGAGGSTPRPRKDSPATLRMVVATPSVPCTITGDRALGTIYRRMMWTSEAPTARAASMYYASFTDRTEERTIRANCGIWDTDRAISRLTRLGPSAATRAMASTRLGTVIIISMTRMMQLSTIFP